MEIYGFNLEIYFLRIKGKSKRMPYIHYRTTDESFWIENLDCLIIFWKLWSPRILFGYIRCLESLCKWKDIRCSVRYWRWGNLGCSYFWGLWITSRLWKNWFGRKRRHGSFIAFIKKIWNKFCIIKWIRNSKENKINSLCFINNCLVWWENNRW